MKVRGEISRHEDRAHRTLAEPRVGPRRAPRDGGLQLPVTSSPTAQAEVDELIIELARYCAEVMFEARFSTKPANDDS
jgi:hypothetical protein